MLASSVYVTGVQQHLKVMVFFQGPVLAAYFRRFSAQTIIMVFHAFNNYLACCSFHAFLNFALVVQPPFAFMSVHL